MPGPPAHKIGALTDDAPYDLPEAPGGPKGHSTLKPEAAAEDAVPAAYPEADAAGLLAESRPGRRPLCHWTKMLRDLTPLDLKLDKKHVTVHKQGAASATALSIPALATDQAEGSALLLLLAWSVLLARYCRVEDVCVGVAAEGKKDAAMGIFSGLLGSKVLPLVCPMLAPEAEASQAAAEASPAAQLCGSGAPSRSFTMDLAAASASTEDVSEWSPARDLVSVLQGRLKQAAANSGTFLPEKVSMQAGVNLVDVSHPFFQAMFVWVSSGQLEMRSPKQRRRSLHPFGDATAACPLQLRFTFGTAGIAAQIVYLEDFFHQATVEHMAQQLKVVFCQARAGPQMPVNRLPMMDEKARRHVLEELSDGTRGTQYPQDVCVHSLFEDQRRTRPEQTALISGSRAISYETFGWASDRLAAELRALGCQAEALVGLIFSRGVEMLVAIYGTLKAGGAYVPMDPHYPEDRIRSIMDDIGAPALLSTSTLAAKAPRGWPADRLVLVDLAIARYNGEESVAASPPPEGWQAPSGSSPVYVFFTSGTTGKPKGVVVEHKGLVHRTLWLQEEYGMQPAERTALKHGYTFGLSEWEIFWPICVGGSLVVLEPDGEKRADYVYHTTQQQGITHMFFVPSMLRMLLEYMELESIDVSAFPLRLVVTCGEALPLEVVHKFFQLLPTARLHNLYGPTEGEMTLWKCPKGVQIPYVPIGRPMPGCTVLVCDRAQQPCAMNVPGELLFGGPFIARGYLGLEALTKAKFIPDPVSDVEGARTYCTGDLATWRSDGYLEFNGRIDNQIKLRGFRIELGEIEAVLRSYGLQQAVVLLHGSGGNQMLVAYCAPAKPADTALIRSECAKKLPSYMVPSAVVPLAAMPLTDRGKIDRKALPAPPQGAAAASDDTGFVQPRNAVEREASAIWAEVLKVDRVSVEADFQALGGNSLLAGSATSRLRRAFPRAQLPGTVMYTHPTVAKLAQLVAERLAQAGEESASGALEVTAPREHRYRGLSGTRPAALLFQTAGLVLLAIIASVEALQLLLSYWVLYQFSFLTFCLVLPLLEVFGMGISILCMVGVKWLLFPTGAKPGRYPVYGWYYFRWWVVHQMLTMTFGRTVVLFTGTPLLNACLWLLGARIGRGVLVEETYGFTTPDLVSIGDGCHLEPRVDIQCHTIVDGELILGRVELGAGCRVGTSAVLTLGTRLVAGTCVGPDACTHGYQSGLSQDDAEVASEISVIPPLFRAPPRRVWWLPYVGIPYVLILESLPEMVSWYLMLELYDAMAAVLEDGTLLLCLWCLTLAYVFTHVSGFLFILLCVLQKRLLIGRFQPGSRAETADRTEFCRWLLHVLVASNPTFVDTLEPFCNTEVLRLVYALLGCRYGRRVQTDLFWTREPDLVSVGDYCVFGFNVALNASDAVDCKPIALEPYANVLDNCVLMPGSHVGERAILGSNTLGAKDSYFLPDSVSTGNKRGRAVMLRAAAAPGAASANREEQQFELLALHRVDSPCWWWSFNLGLVLSAVLLAPLTQGAFYVSFAAAIALCEELELELWMILLLTPALALVIDALVCFLEVSVKWLLVGRFRERNYAFMGWFHFKWMLLMMINRSTAVETLPGTVFYNWFYRANGARVGRNVCNFGFTLEYDMFSADSYACIGEDCDGTCHTVERMVLKVAPVKVGAYASMCAKAVVMPGGALQPGALLLEHSQVLKGDTVPEDECWRGLPAEKVQHAQYRSAPGHKHLCFLPTVLRRFTGVSERPESGVSHLLLRCRGQEVRYDEQQVTKRRINGRWGLVVSFTAPITVTEYAFTTGGGDPGYDPVRWQLLGSNQPLPDEGDNEAEALPWAVLDERGTDFATPPIRHACVYCQVIAGRRHDTTAGWPSKRWARCLPGCWRAILLMVLLAVVASVVALVIELDTAPARSQGPLVRRPGLDVACRPSAGRNCTRPPPRSWRAASARAAAREAARQQRVNSTEG